ncbi:MAG: GAF domain-containing protein [Candidatus Wallbacteria bacterium]|nr:GAF domain-containing protein [Candidatus Wallbacteria bacterium]
MPRTSSKSTSRASQDQAGEFESRLLAVLLTVARDMNSEKDIDRLLAYIPQVVAEMAGAERCTIFLLDHESRQLWSRVATGAEREIRVPIGSGIAGHVAATGEVVNIADAYQDPRFNTEVDRDTGFKTRSLLCAPLRTLSGEILGVFQLLNKKNGTFTDRDEEFASLFGSHAAVALEGARLNRENKQAISRLTEAQEQLQDRVHRLETVYAIEREANRLGDFGEILSALTTLAATALKAEAGSILLAEGSEGRLTFYYSHGGKGEELKSTSIARDEGIAGWVLKNMQPTISNDPMNDDRFAKHFADKIEFQCRNLMAAPLRSGEKVLGVIEILNRRDKGFDKDDLEMMDFIAGQIAATLDKKLLVEENQRSQRLASVGNMASRIIHDFKNPFTVIKGITQLFGEGEMAPDKRSRFAKMVMGEVDRCVEMTQEILDFARGDTKYRFCRLNLDEMLAEILPMVEKDCADRGIAFLADISPGLAIDADPSRLKRVFFNLTKNANEAMKDHGAMQLVAKAAGGGVEIRFADRGPGIAEEVRGRLFEAFATHGKPNGTGLGLAICKSVVEGHGGRIVIDPNHKPGTCFVVWLPAAAENRSP